MSLLPDRPLIKICGMRDAAHVAIASEAGADLVGFVFARSKRQVTADDVRPIVAGMAGPAIPTGLFVDETVEAINATAAAAGVRLLQLHWRADDRDLERFELPYLLVRRTHPGDTYETVAPEMDRVLSSPKPPLRLLVDSYHPSASGGTGTLADWDLARNLAETFPVILAGGLNPENVADAIDEVNPAGVDVSSGVECNGTKSPELIRAFVANARAAFGSYSSSSSSANSSQG